jgi:endonuclease G
VTGPIFLTDGYRKLGNSDVGVPDAFFKVILCMNKKPKALGFIYPNEETSNKMRDCVTTVDEVERVTGIDFFYNLPDEIEAMVESVSDIDKW